MNDENVEIMRCYSGSHAYGTNLPSSDTDIRGLFVAPMKFIRTPFYEVKEMVLPEEEDGKMYEVTNFFKLFAEMNPNIIELAFVDESDIIKTSPAYDMIRHTADGLLTKKVAFSFSGYAMAQLKRIKGHDKWISNPQPEGVPTQMGFMRMVFNFTDSRIIKHNEFMAELENLNDSCVLFPYGNDTYAVIKESQSPGMFNRDGSIRKIAYETLPDEVKKQKPLLVVKYLAEDHKLAKEKHRNYWTWKAERNETRHQLEVNFGYDCYLDSSTEFLTEGGFKKYDDITAWDKLATVNKATQSIEFQHFFDRVKKSYTGILYTLDTRDTKCEVTGNHRMLVASRSRKNETVGDFKFIPLEKVDGEFVQLRSTSPYMEDICNFSDKDIILVGAYASEGSLLKSEKGNIKGISLSQLSGGRLCKFIDPLVESGVLRLHQYTRNGRKENTYNLYDKAYGRTMELWCGEYSENKRLPWWITELSEERAKLMLSVLIAGDGSERKHSWIYHTTSKGLADDVQILALQAGLASKIWDYKEKHGMYQVYISKNDSNTEFVYKRNHLMSRECSEENVVCFSVPNETLITRNSGKLSYHGNTKHAMHLVRLMRMAEEILSTGEVLVKRPDAKELLDIRGGAWPLEDLLKWAEEKDKHIRGDLYEKSKLPHSFDRDKGAEILMGIQDMVWHS